MRYTLETSDGPQEIEITRLGPARLQYRLGNGPAKTVDALLAPGLVHLLDGERSHTVRLGARGEAMHAQVRGRDVVVEVLDERKRRAAHAHGAGNEGRKVVRTPMPGKVVKILVEIGDTLEAGQGVIIVEAMKMENELRTPGPGVVKEIRVKPGDTVEGNAELVVIEGTGG